jgi:hypothetical protein
MIDKRTIFEIHRLKHLGWSERKIARHLRIDRGSVKKYVNHPEVVQKRSNRAPSSIRIGTRSKRYWMKIPQSVPRSYCSSGRLYRQNHHRPRLFAPIEGKTKTTSSPMPVSNPLPVNRCRSIGATSAHWNTATPGANFMPWSSSKPSVA